jgi:cell division septation protein DedD
MLTPGLDNLHIITSGTPPQNPAELIDSKRLEEFIEEVKKEYDVIIFDSSPILSTADAAILGMKVDGVLLVYRVGSISKGLLKRTASQLEQVQCNLMGVIVNGINPDISPDFQGYKYYKYYYSYGESKNNKSIGEGKRHVKRPLLMYTAIACLSVGFLWQSGLFALFMKSIRRGPQPSLISSENAPTQKIVKMDMPTPTPPRISPTVDKPEEKSTEAIPPAVQTRAEPAPVEQTSAEYTQPKKKPSEKVVALVSALLYGTAYKNNFIKPAVSEAPTNNSYSLQLGAYSNLEGAKAAVATYREKGISTYWREADLNGEKKLFRVYTGFFKNLGEAKIYKEEQNLLNSIIKKTPSGASVGMPSEKESFHLLKAPEPISLESGTNGSGHHGQDTTSHLHNSVSPQANKPKGKAPVKNVSPEAPPTVVTREKEASLLKVPPEKTLVEHLPAEKARADQTPAEPDQQEKLPVEVASQFSGPFFGKASPSTELRTVSLPNGMSDLKKSEIHETNPKYPYSIQLGAFRTLVEAQNAVSGYREKGISSYWCEVDLEENEKWFRVYTGFFKNRDAARMHGEKRNLRRSIVKETPYSTLIGIYPNLDELETKTLQLSDLGHMPYAIEDQDEKYRLLIGAFVTKQGAEAQRRTLESNGIQSQVIRR